MSIREGRIGRQESAAVTGIAVYTSIIFTLDSPESYRGGNSTYIWVPAAIALVLGVVLFVIYAMKRCGIDRLDILLNRTFGRIGGGIAAGVMIALLLLGAFELLSDFVNLIHSFVFYDRPYWNIVLWIAAAVGLLGFLGLEPIARTARLLLPLFGAILALWLLLPAESFDRSNLFPFPGNTAGEICRLMGENTVSVFAPMVALLTVAEGMHGIKFAGSACRIGVLCALLCAAATQLCLGLTYGYKDLAEMSYPLYRLDMMMLQEGYFFRMDKIALFFWLAMGLIAAAYYVFAAAVLWCRCYGPGNTGPVVLAVCVILACGVQIQAEGYYDEIAKGTGVAEKWAWAAMALPVAAALIQLIRKKTDRRMERCEG